MIVAVIVVEFTTVKPLMVVPPPDTLIEVAPVRLLPVKVTGTAVVPVVGCVPELGLIEVSVAPVAAEAATVNVTEACPVGVVTVTALAEAEANAEIVNVAVI